MMLLKKLIPVLILAFLFILSAYFSEMYKEELVSVINSKNIIALGIYIAITALTTVVAPLSSLPLLPIATTIWGPIIAALTSVIGWVIGSIIIFGICRQYGVPFITRFVSIEKIEKIKNFLPGKDVFLSHIILRMLMPVDLLSYALSLFSSITFRVYIITTVIGVIPFAFVFAYGGMLPIELQIIGFLVGIVVVTFIHRRRTI